MKATVLIEEYNEDEIVRDADNEITVEQFTSAVQVALGSVREAGVLKVGPCSPSLHIERAAAGNGMDAHWQIFIHGHEGDADYTVRIFDDRVVLEHAQNGDILASTDE